MNTASVKSGKCLNCGKPDLRPCEIDGKPGLYCPACGEGQDVREQAPAPRTADLKLGLDPGPPTRKIVLKEADAQQAVKTFLESHGYIVLSTSERRKKSQCHECGAWGYAGHWVTKPDGSRMWVGHGTGLDKGVPDLLVTREDWGCLMGIEMKGTETRASLEQEALATLRCITILRAEDSLDWTCGEALRLVRQFESRTFGEAEQR